MNAKYFLSAISILLLAAPSASAEVIDELAAIHDSPILEESQQLPEISQLSDPGVIPENNHTIESEFLSQPTPPAADVGEIEAIAQVDSNSESDDDNLPEDESERVTSVSELSDVQTSDWAYQALQNLVEKYGIVAGYPDGTFQGERALSRYEFAAALDATIKKIEQLVTANVEDKAKQQDLETLRKLQEQFASELTALQGRVDKLEGRTDYLENHQFSTTVILGGEAIFAAANAFGGGPPGTGKANTVLNYLTRLQIVASFTGKDRLRMELAGGNFDNLGFASPDALNTNTVLLSYQAGTNNNIQLAMAEYRFAAFGDRAVFTFRPVGFSLSSVLSANSPYFDTGRGSISRFGEANPVFKIGALDAGLGMDLLLGNRARLQVAYGTRRTNNSDDGFIFGKNAHATGIQFLLLPGNSVLTGISYVYNYSPDGRLNTFTGSAIADASGFIDQRSNIHALSGTLQWRISPKLTFATWGGIVGTYAAATQAFAVSTNYMFSLGISDPFGRRGDLLALMVGQPPRLIRVLGFVGANGGLLEDSSSFHLEGFYRLTVNNRISITPGFFMVTNPGNIENNKTIYVGVLRTTFRF